MVDTRRVIIVGAGGTGSWLAHQVGRMLEFQAPGSALVIIDGDVFESKNRARQNFSKLGPKCNVVQADLQEFLQDTYVMALPAWIVSEELAGTLPDDAEENPAEFDIKRISAEKLLQEGDIVYAMVDNNAARKLLFDAAEKLDDVDVFTGGNDDEMYGSTYHYRRRAGRNVTLPPRIMHEEFDNPGDRNPGEMNCAERAALDGGQQIIATNAAVAAVLAAQTAMYVFGEGYNATSIPNTEYMFDLKTGSMTANDWTSSQKEEAVAS